MAIESPKELEDELKQFVVGAKIRALFGKLTRYRQEGVPLDLLIQSSTTKNNNSISVEEGNYSSRSNEKIEENISLKQSLSSPLPEHQIINSVAKNTDEVIVVDTSKEEEEANDITDSHSAIKIEVAI